MARHATQLLALWLLSTLGRASAQGMMRKESKESRVGKSALQAAIEGVLKGAAVERMLAIEASVRPTYEAFPKNSMGRIPPQEIFPAIVRGYFGKEHGWLLVGLAPPHLTPKLSEVHDALVLRDGAPNLAQALKELHDTEQGLSLSDVVGTIAAMEHLLLAESEVLLRGAYHLNELPADATAVENKALDEVLFSFLLLLRHGHPYNLTDVARHRRMKVRARKGHDWKRMEDFAREALVNVPGEGSTSFEKAGKMARELTLGYGKWQNAECMQMKETLMDIAAKDPQTAGSGSLTLERFHGEPTHPSYQFTEPREYLRKYGVLAEGAGEAGADLVRIPNYLLAPSNCIASSKHYSICCLNECEALTSDLETQVQAPVWPADRLLKTVSGLSSSSVQTPRQLPLALTEDLRAVAASHEGAVPLHSAEFRRWLHAAFPNECPVPTASEAAAEEWEREAAESWLASQEECTRIPDWHPKVHGENVVNI